MTSIRTEDENLKIAFDSHTHTVACQHAYSTLNENVAAAAKRGLELICLTEHGPGLPGGPHPYFFGNLKALPEKLHGVRILRGIESNIMDVHGAIDLPNQYKKKMDIVLAGLHRGCYEPGSVKDNTQAVIRTLENELVDVLVHVGNPQYPVDYEQVVKAAKDTNTIIEINNSSFLHSRKGSYPNCKNVAEICMKHEVQITLGSDAHLDIYVGDFDAALEMLAKVDFPEEMIMNTSVEKLITYLEKKGRVLSRT